MVATSVSQPRLMSSRSALIAGTLGGILAALGNLLLYLVARGMVGDQLMVPVGEGGALIPLSPLRVAITSFLPGLAAGILYWIFHRWSQKGFEIFVGVSVSFLLFSFTAPLGMPTIPDAARPLLAAMHVVAALAIVGMFVRARSRA